LQLFFSKTKTKPNSIGFSKCKTKPNQIQPNIGFFIGLVRIAVRFGFLTITMNNPNYWIHLNRERDEPGGVGG